MKYVLIILLVLVLVIFIITVTFGAHNDQVVTFNYLLVQSQFRVSTLLTSLFATGFVIGWVICGLFWLRTRMALMRAERKVKRLEQQLAPLERTTAAAAGVPAVAPKE
ncbi:MAG: LapA family protein [Sodalis sp. (in: enterobacteria)]|uniref:LapA family protein n=1 Tax=Sodalis sp. (in: enterobacteria) TaxID=1898979 RepID=UPI003F3653F8